MDFSKPKMLIDQAHFNYLLEMERKALEEPKIPQVEELEMYQIMVGTILASLPSHTRNGIVDGIARLGMTCTIEHMPSDVYGSRKAYLSKINKHPAHETADQQH